MNSINTNILNNVGKENRILLNKINKSNKEFIF